MGRAVAAIVVCLALAGCAELGPRPPGAVSLGFTNRGVLLEGVELPDQGVGFVRARPGESTRFGTPTLVASLERAAAGVDRAFVDSAPLRVGDLSAPQGGRHGRHRSHRTGRDVDLIFYITDAEGASTRGRGWLAFDRFGVAREDPTRGARSSDVFFFDDARNWHLVRTLLLDDAARVQWIFCSRGVKARLLRYAAAHEPSREALFRAAWVLQQPSRGAPHHDHFHVRVACGAEQRALGCRDRGPIWPWLRPDAVKPAEAAPQGLSDDVLVRLLLEDPAIDGTLAANGLAARGSSAD